jgi:hypothetical protein
MFFFDRNRFLADGTHVDNPIRAIAQLVQRFERDSAPQDQMVKCVILFRILTAHVGIKFQDRITCYIPSLNR